VKGPSVLRNHVTRVEVLHDPRCGKAFQINTLSSFIIKTTPPTRLQERHTKSTRSLACNDARDSA
jgi:hypothetical protein